VVDLKHLGLSQVQKVDQTLQIGATTTLADLQALLDATIELGDELLAGGHHWEAYDIRPPV
jgi:CO/xanthine dehydrogenase FAD-binding subunit